MPVPPSGCCNLGMRCGWRGAALQGEPWPAAIAGHVLDPMAHQQEQQRLVLERFQREVSDGLQRMIVYSQCAWCMVVFTGAPCTGRAEHCTT